MTRAGSNAAVFIAVLLTLLASFGGHHAAALAASASALALLTAALLRCTAQVGLLADSTEVARGAAAARSLLRHVEVPPQRDPDAAGKPRPRAPGSTLLTV